MHMMDITALRAQYSNGFFAIIRFSKMQFNKDLQQGHVYMLPIQYYRDYESRTGIIGTGDTRESSVSFPNVKLKFIPEGSDITFVGTAAAAKLAAYHMNYIYCMYALTVDNLIDAAVDDDASHMQAVFGFSQAQQDCIRQHFPSADSALVIYSSGDFLWSIQSTLYSQGIQSCYGLVQYHDHAHPSEDFAHSFAQDESSLVFYKDNTFRQEQELRLLTDKLARNTNEPFTISVPPIKASRLYSIDELFAEPLGFNVTL